MISPYALLNRVRRFQPEHNTLQVFTTRRSPRLILGDEVKTRATIHNVSAFRRGLGFVYYVAPFNYLHGARIGPV